MNGRRPSSHWGGCTGCARQGFRCASLPITSAQFSTTNLTGSGAVAPRGPKRSTVAGWSLRQARANCPLPAPAGRITAINSTPAAKAKPIIK